MKIPLESLQSWDGSPTYTARAGVLADGTRLHVHTIAYDARFAWAVTVVGGAYHHDYSDSLESAQLSADAYLAEHFELPVSLEDKLKEAEKRIEEMEARHPAIEFGLGQRVALKSSPFNTPYTVEMIQIYRDTSTLYTLSNGNDYFPSQLTAVPS